MKEKMGKKETGTRQRWVKWEEDVQQIEERSVRYANLLCVYSSRNTSLLLLQPYMQGGL